MGEAGLVGAAAVAEAGRLCRCGRCMRDARAPVENDAMYAGRHTGAPVVSAMLNATSGGSGRPHCVHTARETVAERAADREEVDEALLRLRVRDAVPVPLRPPLAARLRADAVGVRSASRNLKAAEEYASSASRLVAKRPRYSTRLRT